jgi:hypothetical protein
MRRRAAVMRIEGELGWWNLLSKASGNDGVIALCADERLLTIPPPGISLGYPA